MRIPIQANNPDEFRVLNNQAESEQDDVLKEVLKITNINTQSKILSLSAICFSQGWPVVLSDIGWAMWEFLSEDGSS